MDVNVNHRIAIGADIGGSHISCAAVDLEVHKLIKNSYTVIDVDNKAGADEIIEKWAKAIMECLAKIQIDEPSGIGLAMPGPFDYEKGIGLFKGVQKFENLYNVDVAGRLKEIFNFQNNVPIRFINDATSFAVGAVWADDSLRDKSVLAVTLGTGFGSAFILNSLPVLEDETVPDLGCLYHIPYKNGIADDTFSTRGIIKSFEEKSGTRVGGVKDIADLAPGDKLANDTFIQFGKEFAEFLSEWIEKASVTDMIIGGNISKAYSLFRESFESEFKRIGQKVNVKISEENDLMAILGSARLSESEYWNSIKPLLKYM